MYFVDFYLLFFLPIENLKNLSASTADFINATGIKEKGKEKEKKRKRKRERKEKERKRERKEKK